MPNELTDTRPSLLTEVCQKATAAIKHNLYAAILLWSFGCAIVAAYFLIPSVHESLESLREFKTRVGWIFAAVSTAIFAGLIPVVIPQLFGRSDTQGVDYLISNIFFWAYKGVEVDWFYILQAKIFGTDSNLSTIVLKVAVDQVIYAPLLGLLTGILFYLWRDNGYSWKQFRVALGKQWYRKKVLPILVSNWFVWIPACVLVYCLPLGLQLPIQNLILCFWVLILAFYTENSDDKTNQAS